MKDFRLLAAVAALSASVSSVATAQTCLGQLDLTVTKASLGAVAKFADNVNMYGGRIGVNSNTAFGGLSVGSVSFDGVDDVTATTFGGDVGIERHPFTSKRVHVCPVLSLDYQNGPNSGTDKISALSAGVGAALGASFPLTPTVSFVPFARAGLLSVRSKSDLLDDSNTETGGLLGLGASFRFNDIFALTPSLSIPVGFDNSDTIFSLSATIGFRRR